MRRIYVIAVLSAICALAIPAAAGAHPYYMPMNKGKQAISSFAQRVADGLPDGWFAGLSGCVWVRHALIGCTTEYDFDNGIRCTAPVYARYTDASNRIHAFGDKNQIHCRRS